MKKKVVIAGVVVAAIAVVAGLSLSRGKQTEEETLIPVVNVENPQTGSIELYRSLVGKVEPSDVVYIYPKAAGEITDVFVKAGDMVQEGQPICKIDTKQVEAARLQMESAQQAMNDANTNLNRQQALFAAGDIASVAFEQAQTQAKNAQISYDSAKLNYDYQVEFANVTAPISGKVETCNIEVHDNVASQVLLAVISGAGSKSITFSVPEKVVTELHVGDPISVDKNGTDYQGTINEVSSMIDDSTGLFKVKASVENGDALPTGSTTKLSVISDRADNVLTIPVDAVYYSGGDAYVYTYDNGTVHYVPVEVGLYDSEKAQILSGINASDEVITTWSSELYEGSQVQKADPAAAASIDSESDAQNAEGGAADGAQTAENAESTESAAETKGN
ncbi:efflux RND transporter periplasmic adaptor subunit [Clostridium sp. AF32-12BH]|uniref:efflux RND transporter periplasmic adaptor subunit n=1 Tax=Clostridium sp. AF32-12BH TaxID=2292006 RepID=UPI000E4FD6D5|nr:efflux RND transporter periplasmic adaptor subunit [Clostridium sp. AF32-12BH]RHP47886.1 efflux RND transporter periplasmic adaptor subunit [Clostridium sp. AF32-12BH]